MEAKKLKVLFVCTANVLRSKTAEEVYRQDERFEVQSAGTSAIKEMAKPIDVEVLDWADLIVVMEKYHKNRIHQKFPEIYAAKKIICLHIPDIYDFMQPELVALIKEKFEKILQEQINI